MTDTQDVWKWKELTFDEQVDLEMALPAWERPSTLETNLRRVMI